MRIVYLHQYFNTPDMPGSTRSYEMARRWSEAGHDVEMVTSDRGKSGNAWQKSVVDGITVHSFPVPYSNSMGTSRRILAFLKFVVGASLRARGLRGDVVFATSTPLTIILPALYACIGRRTPIVFEVRDLWPEMPIAVGKLTNPLGIAAARWLERLAYRRSAAVVALSPGMAEGVYSAGTDPSKVCVAPNSCDIARFRVDDAELAKFREANTWIDGRKLVVYCGTFGEINDVTYLVRVAAEMKKFDRGIVFALYGDGRDRTSAVKAASECGVLEDNLFIFQPVPKREVPLIFSAATVVTSLFKPIPAMEANSANKFFDALAAGRPLAVNYGGWQAELLSQHNAGIRLDNLDYECAARALSEFVSNSSAIAEAGVAAHQLGGSQFSRDQISMRVLSVIEGVTGRPGIHPTPSTLTRR